MSAHRTGEADPTRLLVVIRSVSFIACISVIISNASQKCLGALVARQEQLRPSESLRDLKSAPRLTRSLHTRILRFRTAMWRGVLPRGKAFTSHFVFAWTPAPESTSSVIVPT